MSKSRRKQSLAALFPLKPLVLWGGFNLRKASTSCQPDPPEKFHFSHRLAATLGGSFLLDAPPPREDSLSFLIFLPAFLAEGLRTRPFRCAGVAKRFAPTPPKNKPGRQLIRRPHNIPNMLTSNRLHDLTTAAVRSHPADGVRPVILPYRAGCANARCGTRTPAGVTVTGVLRRLTANSAAPSDEHSPG